MAKKKVKVIKVNADECNGCRACEVFCAAFHAQPPHSSVNPAKARIRVIHDPIKNIFLPILAGPYTVAECPARNKYTIDGREYEECAFCGASCPSRGYFKDPDSGLPLKCDACETEPPLEEPWCVKVCLTDALTYEEREEEVEEEKLDELEIGLESLVDRYGLDKVMDTLARIAASKRG